MAYPLLDVQEKDFYQNLVQPNFNYIYIKTGFLPNIIGPLGEFRIFSDYYSMKYYSLFQFSKFIIVSVFCSNVGRLINLLPELQMPKLLIIA
jgi:hypothetical protein